MSDISGSVPPSSDLSGAGVKTQEVKPKASCLSWLWCASTKVLKAVDVSGSAVPARKCCSCLPVCLCAKAVDVSGSVVPAVPAVPAVPVRFSCLCSKRVALVDPVVKAVDVSVSAPVVVSVSVPAVKVEDPGVQTLDGAVLVPLSVAEAANSDIASVLSFVKEVESDVEKSTA